jgi:hypothetical protein
MLKQSLLPKGYVACGPHDPWDQIRVTPGGRKTPRKIYYIRKLDPFELATAGRFIGPALPPEPQPQTQELPTPEQIRKWKQRNKYNPSYGGGVWKLGHRD